MMRLRFTVLCFCLLAVCLKGHAQCVESVSYTVSPQPGPGNTYAPGEVVTFCFTVNAFNQDSNNSNWMHGMTIVFGPAWDTSSVTVISLPQTADTNTITIPTHFPDVWGYFPNGVTSSADSLHFGAGFYYETGNGNIPNGYTYDGNPGHNYGDQCPASGTCSWTVCFSVQVSPTAPQGTSATLGILPSSDGESGAWIGGVGYCHDTIHTITPPNASVSGPVLVINSTTKNVSCFGLCNGSATVTAYNGKAPYTYKWNTVPVQQTAAASNLCAGNYTCIVTDSLGVMDTASVSIKQPAVLALTDSIVNPRCNGSCNGAVITKVTGGTLPYSYAWIGGAAPNSAVDYSVCAGKILLTVTDSNNCALKDSFVLTQPAVAAVNLVSQTNIPCRGEKVGALVVNYSGGNGGAATYNWSDGTTAAADTGITAGTYVITASDNVGCSASASYTITEPATGINLQNPVVTPATCMGRNDGGIIASATGGVGALVYTWTEVSNSSPFSGAVLTNLATDNYDLTVTDASGCYVTAGYAVNSPPGIMIDSFIAHNITCYGAADGDAAIFVHGGVGKLHYMWNKNSTDTLSSIKNLLPGLAKVIVSDAKQCSVSDSAFITQAPAMNLTVTNQTNNLCNGDAKAGLTVTATGGAVPYSYVWSNNVSGPTDSLLAAATYLLTVTDANHCAIIKSYNITEPALLVAAPVVRNVLCFGAANGSIDANPQGGTGPYQFIWSPQGTGQAITALAPGAYSCSITDANGCAASLNEAISQPLPLNFTLTPFAVRCFGQKTGLIVVAPVGGTAPYGYSATQDYVNFVYGTSDSINGLDTGAYVVVLSDNNGCTQSQPTYIPDASEDVFNTIVDSTSCNGKEYTDGEVVISAVSLQNAPYLYSIDGGSANYTGYFGDLSAGQHFILAVNANGCRDTTAITVYQPAKIHAAVQPDSISLALGDNKAVQVTYTNATNPSFSWVSDLGLSCSDCQAPVITPYTSGDYTVTVSQHTTRATCFATAVLHVEVGNHIPVFVPSAFSPNGDGNNDVFRIYGEGVKMIELRIFNRWGELIYSSNNAMDGWDGTYKGQPQEIGVYLYESNITFLDDSQMSKNGSVTLVR